MFKRIVGLGFSTKGKNAKDVKKYIAGLVEGGANEFFTGYNPPYWYEKFGFEVSPNGRFAEHEQITDIETLRQIVEEVHSYGLEIFINLNAWYYTDVTFPYIEKMIEEFKEVGVDGIICGNISVLEYLKSIKYPGKINISTILAVYNTQAIAFMLENYTINKVILSREITLKEIEKIVLAFPETKFEVFGEGDFCRYNNGLCYAEHKYGERDICTVVVNDLIYKKKFRADFKKIILDASMDELEKIEKFDDTFYDIFDQIGNILSDIELGVGEREGLEKDLLRIFKISKNRVDLFFDGMTGPNNEKNKKIITFFKGLNHICNTQIDDETLKQELINLKNELEKSIQTGMKYFLTTLKNIGGSPKLEALEKNLFYARGDALNLYSYIFFSKYKNIETVKFPTRGRNYNEKLNLIQKVVGDGEISKDLLVRGMSIERAHYDLTYIFGDKLWFREMMEKSF